MRTRRWIFVGGFASLFFFCALSLSAAQKPLWSLDLNASAEYRNAASHSLQQGRRIVVLDDNNLLVLSTFLHDDSSTGFLALIDGSTGLIRKSLALGDFPGAMMAGSGYDVARLSANRFLVAIGDDLRLGLSPELSWLRSRTIPPSPKNTPRDDRGGGRVFVSLSGRTVFIEKHPETSYRIDPDSLATRDASPSLVEFGVVGVTDREFVGNTLVRAGDAPSFLAVRQPFGERAARPLCESCQTEAIFGRERLVLSDSRHFWIADGTGRLQYRDPREIDPSSVAFAGSSMTDRIAFTYLNSTRDRDAYVVDEQVAVLDVARGKDIFSMSLNSERKTFPQRFGLPKFELLLSPDGKRLGVLRENVLRYFVLN
jgi:hypothetical protein